MDVEDPCASANNIANRLAQDLSLSDDDGDRRERLPDELLLRILGLFVPESGICISNDPDIDVHLLTIRSLLQSCRKIRDELLRRTFKAPLRVFIVSGRRCRCKFLTEPKDIFNTPLGKVLRLPLAKWSEVIIHFTPEIHGNPRRACVLEREQLLITLPKDADLDGREFRAARNCVARHSQALGHHMRDRPYIQQNRNDIRFRFVFDGSRGIDERNISRTLPLWDCSSVVRALEAWRWTSAVDSSDLPRVEVPTGLTLAFDRPNLDGIGHQLGGVIIDSVIRPALARLFVRGLWQFWRGKSWSLRIIRDTGEMEEESYVGWTGRGRNRRRIQQFRSVPLRCFAIELERTLPDTLPP